jgi:hypothetical protein
LAKIFLIFYPSLEDAKNPHCQNIHKAMWKAIGLLFVLSWIELALEFCGTFMPYHRALKPLHKDSNAFGDENQNDQDPDRLACQPITENHQGDPHPV